MFVLEAWYMESCRGGVGGRAQGEGIPLSLACTLVQSGTLQGM